MDKNYMKKYEILNKEINYINYEKDEFFEEIHSQVESYKEKVLNNFNKKDINNINSFSNQITTKIENWNLYKENITKSLDILLSIKEFDKNLDNIKIYNEEIKIKNTLKIDYEFKKNILKFITTLKNIPDIIYSHEKQESLKILENIKLFLLKIIFDPEFNHEISNDDLEIEIIKTICDIDNLNDDNIINYYNINLNKEIELNINKLNDNMYNNLFKKMYLNNFEIIEQDKIEYNFIFFNLFIENLTNIFYVVNIESKLKIIKNKNEFLEKYIDLKLQPFLVILFEKLIKFYGVDAKLIYDKCKKVQLTIDVDDNSNSKESIEIKLEMLIIDFMIKEIIKISNQFNLFLLEIFNLFEIIPMKNSILSNSQIEINNLINKFNMIQEVQLKKKLLVLTKNNNNIKHFFFFFNVNNFSEILFNNIIKHTLEFYQEIKVNKVEKIIFNKEFEWIYDIFKLINKSAIRALKTNDCIIICSILSNINSGYLSKELYKLIEGLFKLYSKRQNFHYNGIVFEVENDFLNKEVNYLSDNLKNLNIKKYSIVGFGLFNILIIIKKLIYQSISIINDKLDKYIDNKKDKDMIKSCINDFNESIKNYNSLLTDNINKYADFIFNEYFENNLKKFITKNFIINKELKEVYKNYQMNEKLDYKLKNGYKILKIYIEDKEVVQLFYEALSQNFENFLKNNLINIKMNMNGYLVFKREVKNISNIFNFELNCNNSLSNIKIILESLISENKEEQLNLLNTINDNLEENYINKLNNLIKN